jgi:hypothetical protein
VSELLTIVVKVSHGDLICLLSLIVLLSHDLDPKGFYSGRDESDLGSMT